VSIANPVDRATKGSHVGWASPLRPPILECYELDFVTKEFRMHRESKSPNLHAELFHRHSANPILTARDWPYPAHTVFNAGACQLGDETILLVRVEDRRGHSHLTVARGNGGVSNRQIDSKP